MTPHQVLTVAVRLFAICVAIYVVRDVAVFSIFSRERGDPQATLAIVMGVVASVVFTVLWFFPKSIARGLLTTPAGESSAPVTTPDAWFGAGSALIGLWLVATAVPALLRNGLVAVLYRFDLQGSLGPVTDGLIFYAIQAGVGLAFIFGANGVRRFLVWARNA